IKSVYWIEDQFEKLPLPWVLWPAAGGLAVGLLGWFEPRSLGVGYDNITLALQANIPLTLAFSLLIFKFVSWSIALASGTSGGTLAPLMTLGSAFGLLFSAGLSAAFPFIHIDPQI